MRSVKKISLILMITLISSGLIYAQKSTITISFVVTLDSVSVDPDSISIQNLTTAYDTTLYGYNTTLVVDYVVGLEDNQLRSDELILPSNYPNPFIRQTYFNVSVPDYGELFINVYNINGMVISKLSDNYLPGNHKFTFISEDKGLYFINVVFNNKAQTIKLYNIGGSGNQEHKIEYLGSNYSIESEKISKAISGFDINHGDQLRSLVYYQQMIDTNTFMPTNDTTVFSNFSSSGNPPDALFSANPTYGTLPLMVNFIDSSANNPTSWHWDFGDGYASNQQNASHQYTSAGIYTVSLTVTNSYGSDTETKNNYIVVYSPPCSSSFVDSRDSMVYSAIQIGSQCWMSENLAYLPSVKPPGFGSNAFPNYYVYDYSGIDVIAAKATNNYQTYGVLYNWSAALNACPAGWHLPSNNEWIILINYLGGYSVAGGELKEAGTTHWNPPNTAATNNSGFTALPGGKREDNGTFMNLGIKAYFWTYDQQNVDMAVCNYLYNNYPDVTNAAFWKERGFSVRCIK